MQISCLNFFNSGTLVKYEILKNSIRCYYKSVLMLILNLSFEMKIYSRNFEENTKN